jgi:hypothetical protein
MTSRSFVEFMLVCPVSGLAHPAWGSAVPNERLAIGPAERVQGR